MPAPPGRVDVTKDDIGAAAPITTLELPQNGGLPKAEDLRNIWAASAKNDDHVRNGTGGLSFKYDKVGGPISGLVTANAGLTVASGQTLTLNGTTVAGNFAASGVPTLNAGVVIANTQNATFSGAKTYTRTIDHAPLYDDTYWQIQLDAQSLIPIYASLTIATGTTELVWVWRPPSNATVTAASVYLTPGDTPTHGGVPDVTISVTKLVRGSLGAADLFSQLDPSGNVTAYEEPHPLTVSGFTLTFTEGDLLLVRVTPETGPNAEMGLKVEAPIITFTRTILGEE